MPCSVSRVVWAFAVTAYEVLTGGFIPYHTMPDDASVVAHVCGGGQLDRPNACADPAYDPTCMQCAHMLVHISTLHAHTHTHTCTHTHNCTTCPLSMCSN